MTADAMVTRRRTADPTATRERRTLPPDVAAALRRARWARGLSLRGAARAVGIVHAYVHALEHGTRCPSAEVAELLVAGLGLDADLARRLRALAVGDAGRCWPGWDQAT